MKKSLVTAVCAATLLMGTTAFADEYDTDYATKQYHGSYGSYDSEYSVMHPFYMPAKGHGRVDVGYSYEKYKFDNDNVKFIFPGKRKTKEYFFEETVALSDTWFMNVKYSAIEDKLKSEFSYNPSSYTSYSYKARFNEHYENWYMGLTKKFMDDELSFAKGSIFY